MLSHFRRSDNSTAVVASQISKRNHPVSVMVVALSSLLTIGLQDALAAPGDHVHTPPDGTLSAVGANSSFHWAAVGTSMYVDLNLASPDDVDYINGALVNANYVDSEWDGGSKGICSPSVHATDSRWTATGTGYTTITVTLRDKTDNAETNDTNPVKTLTNTVGGFTLDRAIAHQLYGGNRTYSHISVNNPGQGTLYICPSNQYELEVISTPESGPFDVWLRYNHLPGGTPVTGDFSGANPIFGPVASGATHLNYIGIDVDRDGVLDQAEETTTINVTRISLSGGSVHDNRTSAPSENLYPLVAGEHMEVGGTFHFELQGPTLDSGVLIGHEIWDLDGIDDLIAVGTGISFSYTWAMGVDEGDVLVRFYLDCNGNGQRDSGEDKIDSEDFWVQQKYVYTKNTMASTLAGVTGPTVSTYYANSAAMALRRDTADDYRACIDIVRGTFGTFTPSPTAPDPITTDSEADIHYGAAQDVTIVTGYTNSAGETLAGQSWNGKIIISWPDKTPETIVHEIGHTQGLGHPNEEDPTFTDRDNIMGSGDFKNSGANKLMAGQADTFD